MALDQRMRQFRVASRELFNNYFRLAEPYPTTEEGWILEEQFQDVQKLLFQKMVAEPEQLKHVEYGKPQQEILVMVGSEWGVPWMLNRETNSGYWDDPLDRVTRDARLIFISYFDFDQLGFRDNQYVRAQVANWPAHPETLHKHALIEAQYVRFTRSNETTV
jgi:hypothetical protein